MNKYKLEFVILFSGAVGMGLELLAARILSPYVGSSSVVWTCIIGVILLSMSVGYLYGGKMSEKNTNLNSVAFLLFIASLFVSLISLFESLFVKYISLNINNLAIAAIFCSILLFSIPSFILAMISPIIIKIKCKKAQVAGSISGKLSSLNTIGSILGTFFIGLFLIPYVGIRNINLGIVILLLSLSFWVRENKSFMIVFLYFLAMILFISFIFLGKIIFRISNSSVILDVDSKYSRIWVLEENIDDIPFKILQVDTACESIVFANSNLLPFGYLNYFDLFDYYHKGATDVLLIGGAAYTYPSHFLMKFKDKNIDVVEIDEKMTDIASEYFNLNVNNNRLKIYNQDGRSFLNYNKNKYDVIMIDAFKGKNIPFELTTYEALINANSMLNDNGIVLVNLPCSIDGKDSSLLKYEYATYKAVFEKVLLFAVDTGNVNVTQNLILVGIKGKPQVNKNRYNFYSHMLNTEVKNVYSYDRILTDDFSPVGI